MPGTKYDRFFIEEFTKKIKQTEDIGEMVNTLTNLKATDNAQKVFEELISNKGNQAEKEREQARKDDQAKREEEAKRINEWSAEEISKLTKAIVKFPGGIPNRWKVIADFVGDRTQKQVIAKAQELS